MELKVGSRIKCLKTSAEFMVVKLGDGTLTNSGQKLVLSTSSTRQVRSNMCFIYRTKNDVDLAPQHHTLLGV